MPTKPLTGNERAVLTAYGNNADIPQIMATLRLPHRTVSRIVVDIANVSRAKARTTVDEGTWDAPERQQADAPAPKRTARLTPPAAKPSPLVPRSLSNRQLDVLQLVADGLTTEAIAQKLGISVSSTHKHVRSCLGKLQVNRRVDAVAVALRLGLIVGVAVPHTPAGTKPLSAQELVVLVHACNGLIPSEIGRAMGLSQSTVRTHLGRVTKKLGADGLANAVAIAIQIGLFDDVADRRPTKAEPQ